MNNKLKIIMFHMKKKENSEEKIGNKKKLKTPRIKPGSSKVGSMAPSHLPTAIKRILGLFIFYVFSLLYSSLACKLAWRKQGQDVGHHVTGHGCPAVYAM